MIGPVCYRNFSSTAQLVYQQYVGHVQLLCCNDRKMDNLGIHISKRVASPALLLSFTYHTFCAFISSCVMHVSQVSTSLTVLMNLCREGPY
jgi:hypothetical protein